VFISDTIPLSSPSEVVKVGFPADGVKNLVGYYLLGERGTLAPASEQKDSLLFYSSNPYVSGQALHYSRKIHRGLNRAEFVKMCSDGVFTLWKEPNPVDANEVWVYVNTIRNGVDTFAEADNLMKTAASMTRRLKNSYSVD